MTRSYRAWIALLALACGCGEAPPPSSPELVAKLTDAGARAYAFVPEFEPLYRLRMGFNLQ